MQSVNIDSSLDSLPAWKRDLILRKRAGIVSSNVVRPSTLGGPLTSPTRGLAALRSPVFGTNEPTAANGSVCSVEGYKKQLLSDGSVGGASILRSSAGHHFSSREGVEEGACEGVSSPRPIYNESGDEVLKSVLNSNCNNSKMHQKAQDNTEEVDLEYGPGIVSKLKNRYMSLAMRDTKARPTLRRFSSLEDLLDEEAPPTRGRATTNSSSASSKREAMKRARSVDSLSAARIHQQRRLMDRDETDGGEDYSPVKLESIKSVFEKGPAERKAPPSRGLQRTTGHKPLPKAKPLGLLPRRSDNTPEKTPKQLVSHALQNGSRVSNGVETPTRGRAPLAPKTLASPTKESPVVPPPVKSPSSVESSRVLLENRKNAQKSRRVDPPSPQEPESQNLKPTVVEETVEVAPPALPSRNTSSPIAPPVRNTSSPSAPPARNTSSPAAPPVRNTSSPVTPPVRNISSPVAPPVAKLTPPSSPVNISSPSKQILSPIPPTCHTSTPNEVPQSKERSLLRQTHSPPTHKPSRKAMAPSPPPISSQTPPEPVRRTEKTPPVRPSTRPPSPPINHNHFVSLKASAPKVSPTSSVENSPSRSFSKPPSPPLKDNVTKEKAPPQADAYPTRGTKVTSFSSTSDEVTEVIEAVNTKAVGGGKSSKDKWHQEQSNSLVFNFLGTKATPDYIENDGVDISKKINKHRLDSGYVKLPGYDDCDSSTDDWDEMAPAPLRAGDALPPCPFDFVGDAIIIRGRSNLQRQPRSKKLTISFNDTLTKTFEYPSEASLIEDPDEEGGLAPPTLGLSSYTPSKLALGDAFELGVSRTLPPPTSKRPAPEGEEGVQGGKEEEYLRPAAEEETVPWSAGSSSDMLF